MSFGPKNIIIAALFACFFGFVGAALYNMSSLSEQRTKDYLLANPEILPEMAEAFRRNQVRERLAGPAGQVMVDFPGAVLGNPEGSKLLVKFTDYNCVYCEASRPDIDRLISEDPELKVVIREWPVFRNSEIPARMGLAAAKQGRYAEFHKAMFALGPATPESAERAAIQAGMDINQARFDLNAEEITAELARNRSLAAQLGFGGTPSWVTSNATLEGAVGYSALKDALEVSGS